MRQLGRIAYHDKSAGAEQVRQIVAGTLVDGDAERHQPALTRLMNVERAQLMVESPSRPALQAFLTQWVAWLRTHAPSRVRWHVEVDPLEI